MMGGKIIPRIRLTSAKVVVEVEAELGNKVKRLCAHPSMSFLTQVSCVDSE